MWMCAFVCVSVCVESGLEICWFRNSGVVDLVVRVSNLV